jgi:hypothetical protein
MARTYYSEIHLHLVWHAKLSRPLLTAEVEAVAYRAIRQNRLILQACSCTKWAVRKRTSMSR